MSSCLNLRIKIDELEADKKRLIDALENIKECMDTLRHHEGSFDHVCVVEADCLLIIKRCYEDLSESEATPFSFSRIR